MSRLFGEALDNIAPSDTAPMLVPTRFYRLEGEAPHEGSG